MSSHDQIPLFKLNFDEAEERAVLNTLRSQWISTGPKAIELETRYAKLLGVEKAVALNSCTAALHLAMIACGIGPGDEVIVPSMTFVASVNAVLYVGATPVFADIESVNSPLIDPKSIAAKITKKTKAILVVHYAGFACNMDAVAKLAKTHKLKVIEDCAHSPLAEYKGRKLGALGDVSCFSFFSNKNITCAEGGLLATNDAAIAKRVGHLRSHGMTTLSYDRAKGHANAYDVVETGYNYRLDDIRASIVVAQLDKLEDDIGVREKLRAKYVDKLSAQNDVIVPFEGAKGLSSNYIFPIVLDEKYASKRDLIRELIKQENIITSVHYPPAHRFQTFKHMNAKLPHTEAYGERTITLPFFYSLTEAEMDRVVAVLAKVIQDADKKAA